MVSLIAEGDRKATVYQRFWTENPDSFLNEIPFRQRQIRMFGKMINEPRLTAWFGKSYAYSGLQLDPTRLPPYLQPLFNAIVDHSGFEFNSVLINLYRNGEDYMGWHRDNEPEIDQQLIASMSFGATRKFKIRNRQSGEVTHIDLENGDLLLMENLQVEFEHCLPKTKRPVDQRVNLTFRQIR